MRQNRAWERDSFHRLPYMVAVDMKRHIKVNRDMHQTNELE